MVKTYSSVGDSKETEEHILIPSRCDLGHHGLSIRIIRGLEQAKENIVNPEIPDMVISDFIGPQAEHTIKWDEDTEGIGDNEHVLGLNPEILLDIPKTEGRES